jgi:hypothetical protein
MPKANAQKTQKKRVLEKRYAALERLFRTAPVRYTVKNGSGAKVIVEHRVGRLSGSYSSKHLLAKTGLEKEWMNCFKKYEKKIRDRAEFDRIMDSMLSTQKSKLMHMVKGYRTFLEKFYLSQNARPLFSYVPVPHSDDKELYLQGMVDLDNNSVLVGSPEDVALWVEITQHQTDPIKRKNLLSLKIAKQMMKLPGVNKDIQYRMKMITAGNIPTSIKNIGLGASEDE